MSNSSLVTYTRIAKYHGGKRTHAIDTISIHCFVGQVTAKRGCDYFATCPKKASANYVVGYDGSIGLSVEECNRSYCTSSSSNDNRAITIEVACDTKHPYTVTAKAYSALIDLLVDICQRNNIKQLLWKGDKNLIGKVDKQNMTVHRWFAAKACPGEYLYDRHGEIAETVNKRLKSGGSVSTPAEPSKETTVSEDKLYRIRKSWDDPASQKGAYKSLAGAKSVCPAGYTVYDEDGNAVYSKETAQVKTDPATTITTKEETTVNVTLKVLKQGSKGETVKALQRMLYAMGYYLGTNPVDGSFGPKTVAAVKKYQASKKLTQDGVVGEKTWKTLLGV